MVELIDRVLLDDPEKKQPITKSRVELQSLTRVGNNVGMPGNTQYLIFIYLAILH